MKYKVLYLTLILTLDPLYITITISFVLTRRSRQQRQSGRGEEALLRRQLFVWKSSDKWSLEEENAANMDHVKGRLHLPDHKKKMSTVTHTKILYIALSLFD